MIIGKATPSHNRAVAAGEIGQSMLVQRARSCMITFFLGLYLAQIYVTKNGFLERGILGIRAAEVSAAEIPAAEIRAAEVPPRKIFFTGYESH
jgi:hypothetical protein